MPTPPLSEKAAAQARDALAEHGSQSKAARALGITRATLQNRLSRGRELHPHLFQTGDAAGFPAGDVKHYWQVVPDGEGGRVSAFVKVDHQREALADIAAVLAADLPRLPAADAPRATVAALCNVYTLTDAHVGMLSWRKETGADWNIPLAREVLGRCFGDMIDRSPNADIGVVAVLGDWLHWDGFDAVTPASKHILDADTRFPKMVEVGVAILRQIVDAALIKHARVVLVTAEGNHDPASAQWLRVMFTALYEQEPRLRVLPNRAPFYAYQHGETMIGWHHGHTVKPAQLTGVMAAEFPEIWGATRHRHFHCGHMHHTHEKEHPGAVVFQHPTLAARDAYAARHGWKSLRRACAITYHETDGEVGRVYVHPEMTGHYDRSGKAGR